jgi:hypothetical protein
MDYTDINWTERGRCWGLVLSVVEFWFILLRNLNYFQLVEK